MERDPKEPGFFNRYRTAIFISLLSASSIGFLTGLWTSTYMLSNLKAGEYPEMPKELIAQQYQEALPSVITQSIIFGLGAGIFFLILKLYLEFKYRHDVNFFTEFRRFITKETKE